MRASSMVRFRCFSSAATSTDLGSRARREGGSAACSFCGARHIALSGSERAARQRDDVLAKPFALDTRNAGNPVVGWLDAALGLVSRFVPDYPPPIPIAEEYRKRDWL